MTLIDESSDGSSGELARGELVAGRYRIERVLGRGASGTVYEAEHQWTHRRVALKVLRSEWSTHERIVSRFLREARVCAELSHPSLVAVLDMGQDEHDGLLYLAQELVEGETLRALLDARGKLEVDETLRIIGDIAGALAVVHAAGLVHRDIKPENIIVCPLGSEGSVRAKLIDFGVARELDRDSTHTRTQLGAVIGTPRYMSPEQARATGEIDARSDQYALSVVAYECLTGRTPHEGESASMLLANLLTQPPVAITRVRSALPVPVSRAVMRALSREPAERFESAVAFAEALHERAAKRPRIRRAPLAAFAAALTLAGGWLGWRSRAQRATLVQRTASVTPLAAPPSIASVAPLAMVATLTNPRGPDASDARAEPDASDVSVALPANLRSPARAVKVRARETARTANVIETHTEVSTVDAGIQRNWLRPATFGDAGAWLRPASPQ